MTIMSGQIHSNTCDHCDGGGLFGAGGTGTVGNGTAFFNNSATHGSLGGNLHLPGSTVYYVFPVLHGHWLPNGECRVYREPCPTGSVGEPCVASFDACALEADTPSSTPATVPNSECTGTYEHRCDHASGSQTCSLRSFIQPCDWESNPALLGQKIYTLPVGIPIDDAFPYPCAAGVLGSADAQHQTSPMCKGACPAGYSCPSEVTLVPVICPAGYYCPAGSVRPVACPAGTSNGALGATSVSACIDVTQGYWAPVASATPEACPASGFFCPGKQQDEKHGGAKPVLMPVGGSTTTQEVDVVEKEMTLAMTCDEFDLTAVKAALAVQYDCDVALITLSNPCASRRLRALSSGLAMTITISSTATAADGSTVSAPIASLMSAVQTVDDTALGSSLSSALGTTIAVSSTAPTQATAIATVSLVCPRGKWCTAGLVVPCPLGSYNNETGQDFATACKLCPANSPNPNPNPDP